jgi:hypothetical protein
MRRWSVVVALLVSSACGLERVQPNPVTATPLPGSVTETFTGTVSGTDPHCTVGSPPAVFDSGPCQVFPVTVSGINGHVDAKLTFPLRSASLGLEFYDPTSGRVLAYGELTFDVFNTTAQQALTLNLFTPGRYQLRVTILERDKSAPFTIVTTH